MSNQDADLAGVSGQQLGARQGKAGSSSFGALRWRNGFQLRVLCAREGRRKIQPKEFRGRRLRSYLLLFGMAVTNLVVMAYFKTVFK